MIEKILNSQYIIEKPPVLLDIGASGFIHKKWKVIAPHCICLAFDADTRKFGHSVTENSGFKKLITVHKIVSDKDVQETEFYLTESPYCSSALEPDLEKLKIWGFQHKFRVTNKITLPATTIEATLKEAGLTYIDWFKTDSQGTDLRLFNSLPDGIINHILVSEFEPGIIDAYKGEDKMISVLNQMEGSPLFWLADITIKGPQRINKNNYSSLSKLYQKILQTHLKHSPGWAEMVYMRKPEHLDLSTRDLLVLFVFSIIEKQYGFAIEVLQRASIDNNDPLIKEGIDYAKSKLKPGILEIPKAIRKFFKLKYG